MGQREVSSGDRIEGDGLILRIQLFFMPPHLLGRVCWYAKYKAMAAYLEKVGTMVWRYPTRGNFPCGYYIPK